MDVPVQSSTGFLNSPFLYVLPFLTPPPVSHPIVVASSSLDSRENKSFLGERGKIAAKKRKHGEEEEAEEGSTLGLNDAEQYSVLLI